MYVTFAVDNVWIKCSDEQRVFSCYLESVYYINMAVIWSVIETHWFPSTAEYVDMLIQALCLCANRYYCAKDHGCL